MKKNCNRRIYGVNIINGTLSLMILLLIVSSCGTSNRSVRGARAKKGYVEFDAYGRTPFRPTSQGDVITKGLFMQNRRANIELPEENLDPATGQAIAREDVTYTNSDNHSKFFKNRDADLGQNIDTVYGLKEVRVEAKSRFSPEQDGKIAVDFIISLPRQLVSPLWRVTLIPKIIDSDSIIPLEPLIIKGDMFVQRQKDDYAAYDAYLKSIVDTADYDSVFLDIDGIKYDIYDRQKFYYDKYYKEWNRQMAYEKWKVDEENRNERYMNMQLARRNELYHSYMRKANEEGMRNVAYGLDTTGTFGKHMEQYRKATETLPEEWEVSTAVKNIPKEFADIHEGGRSLEDLYNDIMTQQDSMKIAKHRYFFDLIAENELKAARKEDRKKEIIRYPFETNMRDTLVLSQPENVLFLYKQLHPTRMGMRSLSIVLDGRVEAVDNSTYTIGASDTIKFFVSSMAQLVDMSLASNEAKVFRTTFFPIDMNLRFAKGSNAFDMHFAKNREQVEKLVDNYKKFTGTDNLAAGYQVDSIPFTVWTSLEGTYDDNYALAHARGASFIDYMAANYSHVFDAHKLFKLKRDGGGEYWQGFATEVNRSTEIKNKDEIIELIKATIYPEETKRTLRQKYAADFKYITQNIYPKLESFRGTIEMSRPGMTTDTEVLKEDKPDYDRGLELMLDRNYNAAAEIMTNYPDYNTALLLALMGHNGKSLDLLTQLKQNGYTEYLLSILKIRMGNEAEAVEHLKKACELDPSKINRSRLDPEISGLVKKYSLNLSVYDDFASAPTASSTQPQSSNSTGSTNNNSTTDIDAAETASETPEAGNESASAQ